MSIVEMEEVSRSSSSKSDQNGFQSVNLAYDPAMPIAVVGVSCRFPDSASSPEKFWDFLVNARCALRDIPKERFNIDAFWHPSSKRQGTVNVKGGYFLEQDIAAFDAPFFSFTAAEAVSTDPQQRLLLETAYEAIENAGIPMTKLAGSQTSCYVGSFMKDYQPICSFDADDLPAYGSTGHSTALLANRISHFFDLRGPSITLDTGCSGSTVAFHMACESIRTGEAKVALAGGVGAILAPDPMFSMVQFNFLSPDSKCHSFDHRANGYARGEGFSVIVLKPLSDAIRDNDTIRAVIRASSVSQDGKTPGITLPSSDAQAELITATYRKAGLPMDQTGYFEAHGTGTTAGDAAELNAIGRTLGAHRKSGETIHVGSVKTNIGHLEGCAGLAGILKSILAVERGRIPQNLWFQKPHPSNDLDLYRITVPTKYMSWPTGGTRRASINCFGFGGTLAHIILDDAQTYLEERELIGKHNMELPRPISTLSEESSERSSFELVQAPEDLQSALPRLFVWSSTEQDGVKRIMKSTEQYLEDGAHQEHNNFVNLSYTLCQRRSIFAWRDFAVASSSSELRDSLHSITLHPRRSKDNPKLAFVFNGQGGQWYGMGRELFIYHVFHESVRAADMYLVSIGALWSVKQELLESDESCSNVLITEYCQPLCTVLQVALIDLLRSWNIRPCVVVGHSSGEIAAAYAANLISRENAWMLAYQRGRACAQLVGTGTVRGAMMAVGLSQEHAKRYIHELEIQDVVVGCINSTKNVTLSGDVRGIQRLQAKLTEDHVFARILNVECGYHSPHMKRIEKTYADSISGLLSQMPENDASVRMFSTVLGDGTWPDAGPEYWVSNLVSPVQFSAAVSNMIGNGYDDVPDLILEIGAHSTLQSSIKQIFEAKEQALPIYASTLSRGKNSLQTVLSAVGTLWAHGYPVSLEGASSYVADDPKLLTDLEPYPWNHSKLYWHESRASAAYRFRKHPRLDLLGALTPESNNIDMRWRNIIRVNETPWVMDHQVQNTVLYPAAGMICMVLEAAQQLVDKTNKVNGFVLRDVKIGKAMIIPTTPQGLETSLRIRPAITSLGRSDAYFFSITSRLGDELWQEHCTGQLHVVYGDQSDVCASWTKHQANFALAQMNAHKISTAAVYAKFEAAGLKYGRLFQTITDLKISQDNYVTAKIRIPNTMASLPAPYEQPHLIHPTTLDGLFQTVVLAASDAMVPTSISRVFVSASLPQSPGSGFQGYATSLRLGHRGMEGTIVMGDQNFQSGKIILEGVGYTAFSSGIESDASKSFVDPKAKLCSQFVWKEDASLMQPTSTANPTDIDPKCLLDQIFDDYTTLAHKIPEGAVLEVGARSVPLTQELLIRSYNSEDSAPPFFQYNVTNTDDNGQVCSLAMKKWIDFVEYRALNLQQDPLGNGYSKEMYDYCILNSSHFEQQDWPIVWDNLLKIMKQNSRVLVWPEREDLTCFLASQLEASKMKCTRFFDHRKLETAVMYHVNRPVHSQRLKTTTSRILLIEADDPLPVEHALSAKLKARLEAGDYSPTVVNVSNMAKEIDGCICISLIEIQRPFISHMSAEAFEKFRDIVFKSNGVLWLTCGAQLECTNAELAPIHGLFRSMRSEDSGLMLYSLDLEPLVKESEFGSEAIQAVCSTFSSIFEERRQPEEYEFAQRDGRILIPRIKEMARMNNFLQVKSGSKVNTVNEPFQQETALSLDVGSLHFVREEDLDAVDLASDEIEVEVRAINLRQADRHSVDGQTSSASIGQAASGIVKRVGSSLTTLQEDTIPLGARVLCFQPAGGLFMNKVRLSTKFVIEIPPSMSFEVAVSLPWSLTNAARISSETGSAERLMFFGDTCDVALWTMKLLGNSVKSATAVVETEADKEVLLKRVNAVEEMLSKPSFVPTNVLICTEQDILDQVLETTNGEGIDLMIIPQEMQFSDELHDCLAEGANVVQMIETAWLQKSRTTLPSGTKTYAFRKQDLASLCRSKPDSVTRTFKTTMATIFSGNDCHLLSKSSVERFSITDMASAFEFLRHSKAPLAKPVAVCPETVSRIPIVYAPQTAQLKNDVTYLIVGGFGGVGGSLARFLVRHGARFIAILSRSGPAHPEAKSTIDDLRALGASEVLAVATDVCSKASLSHALSQIHATLPPIAGLIHSAMSLSDTLFENMSYEMYLEGSAPKIQGSLNLHELLPRALDFFILVSSVAGVAGTRGQANYNAGNVFQNALAKSRRQQGLCATAIALTVTMGVGWLAGEDKIGIVDSLKSEGVGTVTEDELHAIITPHVSTTGDTSLLDHPPCEVLLGISTGGLLAQSSVNTPLWSHDNRFSWIRRLDLVPEPTSLSGSAGPSSLSVTLPLAPSLGAAVMLVTDALVAKLAVSLLTPVLDIDTSKPISSYGVDSLVAVELRNWVFREARAKVSVFELLADGSIKGLAAKIVKKSALVAKEIVES